MPTIRVIEHRNQLVQSRLSKPRQLRLNEVFRHNPVNPAAVVAAIKVYMLLNAVRQRPRMLNDFAVHIGDVQRAVRADLHLDRPKPIVRRGKELPISFIVGALGYKLYPVA